MTPARPAVRVGIGFDSHRLVEGRPLILGGVHVPHGSGPEGHSDGDALVHAIIDALCGAAGLPDIGQLFPDTDPAWKDADSVLLLRDVAGRVAAQGWAVGNVDAVVIAERPRLAPHVAAMRSRIAGALAVESEQVNLRGKTAEGMGHLGAGEGIAAHAVCLLYRPDEAAGESRL